MAVTASKPGYHGPFLDKVENFHGNQIVYLHWEEHLMFCAALAFPLPPEMPFRDVVEKIIPASYSLHPDFEKIDWSQVRWMLDGKTFVPDLDKSLKDLGIGHKSLIRFWTPGLSGYRGSFS